MVDYMKGLEYTQCKACKCQFLRATKVRRAHNRSVRPMNTVTCSKKCSFNYYYNRNREIPLK